MYVQIGDQHGEVFPKPAPSFNVCKFNCIAFPDHGVLIKSAPVMLYQHDDIIPKVKCTDDNVNDIVTMQNIDEPQIYLHAVSNGKCFAFL